MFRSVSRHAGYVSFAPTFGYGAFVLAVVVTLVWVAVIVAGPWKPIAVVLPTWGLAGLAFVMSGLLGLGKYEESEPRIRGAVLCFVIALTLADLGLAPFAWRAYGELVFNAPLITFDFLVNSLGFLLVAGTVLVVEIGFLNILVGTLPQRWATRLWGHGRDRPGFALQGA